MPVFHVPKIVPGTSGLARFADAPFYGIGANIREAKATAHHARSSLRHGHQLDDVAVVVLVIEATAAIPIVELSVFKAPGPASEGEPSVLDSLQDRVEFGVAYVKRIMLACDSPVLAQNCNLARL